jgi:hypothetical protein
VPSSVDAGEPWELPAISNTEISVQRLKNRKHQNAGHEVDPNVSKRGKYAISDVRPSCHDHLSVSMDPMNCALPTSHRPLA